MNENTSTTNEPAAPTPVETVTALTGLTADEQLVVKIATEYKTPKGAIGWTKAFREHPEWLVQLRTHALAFIVAASLRDRHILPETPGSKMVTGTRRPRTPKVTNYGVVKRITYALAPRNQLVMDMMIKYGDATGKVDWDYVDSKHPGWDKTIPSRKWIVQCVSYYRKSGAFLKHKALAQGKKLTPSQAGKDLSKLRQQKPSAIAEKPRSLGDAMRDEIDRTVAEKVGQTMSAIFSRSGFCMGCGANLKVQFMAAGFQLKH